MSPTVHREADVLVVGAGQAGLATARALQALDVNFVVLERHPRVGDSWRSRFDSLVLFTPRELSSLPGLPHEGDPRGYPGKDEMGDYLERFAEHFALPVTTGSGVTGLRRTPRGFVAKTESAGLTEARAVVVATGGFQRPQRPPFARDLSPRVRQLDALSYRRPAALAEGRVIVVGDGATGRQIALEIARTRPVALATGRKRYFGPQRILGKDTTGLALQAGLLTADKRTAVGRLVRRLDLTPGLHLRAGPMRRAGVELVPRCVGAEGARLLFTDGSDQPADTVIWALGYGDDTRWVDVDGATTQDGFIHERGISPVPGLYFIGREWQNSRASGLICGVARDAAGIAARVEDYLKPKAR